MRNRDQTRLKLSVLAIFIGIAFAINGCGIAARHTRPAHTKKVVVKSPSGVIVYVKKRPPKVRTENPPPRPYESAIWVSGFWKWNGKKYVWVDGYWETKPQGKEWIPGRWENTRNGWLWKPGHWR